MGENFGAYGFVVSLPTRDGNFLGNMKFLPRPCVVSLPTRDGNFPDWLNEGTLHLVVSLPTRDGNEFARGKRL